MKKLINLLLTGALLLPMYVQAQKVDNFHLDINLSDIKDTLLISKLPFGVLSLQSCDTLITQKGKKTVGFTVKEAENILIIKPFHKGDRGIETLSVPAIPGEKAVISGTFDDYSITGSGIYKSLGKAYSLNNKTKEKSKEFENKYANILNDKDHKMTDEERKNIQADYDLIQKEAAVEALAFIKAHPSDHACAIAFGLLDTKDYDAAIGIMDDKVKNGVLKGLIDVYLDRKKKADKIAEAKSKIQPGKPAPDFTLDDINGKKFSLSSLKGKYVILDFWGSWCGWCIKGMPKMKEYYQKYTGKFEIVGVDCNDTQVKWKEAVKKHELPWLHVYNGNKGNTPQNYGIEGYPTKILINPDGTINKVIVGESEEFYNYLDSLFK